MAKILNKQNILFVFFYIDLDATIFTLVSQTFLIIISPHLTGETTDILFNSFITSKINFFEISPSVYR